MFTIGLDTFGNGVLSARAAKYKGNENTLSSMSVDNMRNPLILARKGEIQAETAEIVSVSREEIIRELKKLAGLIDGAKNLNNTERLRSLELLGKTKHMFVDAEHGSGIGLTITVSEAPKLIKEVINERKEDE